MKIYQTVINLQSGHEYMMEMAMLNVQRAINPKLGKPELRFMCSACRPIVVYICMEFCEKIMHERYQSNGADTSTWVVYGGAALYNLHGRNGYVQCSKGNNSKSRSQELRLICSAHRLMVLYIGVKFHESLSNGIKVMKQTRNYEALTDVRTDRRTF